jgi:putrescine aminotransferase
VAAFIGEPIQGAAGVFVPPDGYWPEIQRICRKYDVLLVADEVITGFGRTGDWFGSQHFGIQPDVMTLAKGITSGYIPLGAVMFNDRIAAVLKDKGGELAHGYTYSGHPVCAAVALENIRILQEEGIVERVKTTPALPAAALARAGRAPAGGRGAHRRHDGRAGAGAGQAGAALLPRRGDGRGACRDIALGNGLILRATNDAMLLSPPLVIDRAQIDELFEKAWKSLDQSGFRVRSRLATCFRPGLPEHRPGQGTATPSHGGIR